MFYLFAAPMKMIKSLERDFLWDPNDTKKGNDHLVALDRLRTPLKHGGLGVKSLKSMNKALLSKWLWRYNHERDSLWRKGVATKYRSTNFDRETKAPKVLLVAEFGRAFTSSSTLSEHLASW